MEMEVWSRYILTTERSPSYVVHAQDDRTSACECAMANERLRMWPHHGGFSGLAMRVDTMTRGLVETGGCFTAIQCDAYPEGL
jgi:hypothetical protein